MKKMLNSGLALTLLAFASLSASAQNLLYITDINGKVGTVNLTTDSVTVLGSSGVVLHDIGFTSNGSLYAATSTSLYSMNSTNGSTTLIGSFGGAGNNLINGLVGDGSELIATSYSTNKLYAVDVSPLSTTAFSGTLNGVSNGDATFGANGALYDILTNGDLDKTTISGTTITSTIIGATGDKSVSGMATSSTGQVFAISGTEIYTVDLNTAALTPFLNYAGHGLSTVTGAAIASSGMLVVPEPGNVALLLAGVAGLALYHKRRGFTSLS
jgi:hypothetical protein